MYFFMATELPNCRLKCRAHGHPNLCLFYHKCKPDHFREVLHRQLKVLHTHTHKSYCKSIFLAIWSKVPQHQGFPSKKRSRVNLKFHLRVKQPPQACPSTHGVLSRQTVVQSTCQGGGVCRSNVLGKQVRQKGKHDFLTFQPQRLSFFKS